MRQRLFLSLACAGALTSCEVKPSIPVLQHELNEAYIAATNEDLAADGVALDQLRGTLGMLFGSPANPGFFRTEEWIDDEYDPNFGDLELSDEQWGDLVDANTADFSVQLAHIEAGEYDKVVVPPEKLELRAKWQGVLDGWEEIRAQIETGDATQADLDAYVAENNVEEEDGETYDGYALSMFKEWYPTLAESAEMYRVNCFHCHGVSGGGNGTTAEWLEPSPRDYRRGWFKYTALGEKARPRRADLLNILRQGLYPTTMPNFARMTPAELNGLVDYVRLLAIRGETEVRLASEYDADEGGFALEKVQETYLDVWAEWDASADYVIAFEGEVPRATPETIARGESLFHDPLKANCVSCHGTTGRGDGPSAFEANEDGELVPVKDDWGNEIAPRDLTRGLFRFGRRPIDIYRRIHAGINGTPMPSHAAMKDPNNPSERLMSDADLWSIVHYVQSLSSPGMIVAGGTADESNEGTH